MQLDYFYRYNIFGQFNCSICDLFHLTNTASLEVSIVYYSLNSHSCPNSWKLQYFQVAFYLLVSITKTFWKTYKLSGLHIFGDKNTLPSVLTDILLHMEVLRTGFLMFHKNLLTILYILFDFEAFRKLSKFELLTNFFTALWKQK